MPRTHNGAPLFISCTHYTDEPSLPTAHCCLVSAMELQAFRPEVRYQVLDDHIVIIMPFDERDEPIIQTTGPYELSYEWRQEAEAHGQEASRRREA